MNTPRKLILSLILLSGVCSFSVAAESNFNNETDLFIAQFDNLPDNDDVHSQAAVGSLLAHPMFREVSYFCVAGSWGNQWNHKHSHKWSYINSNELFTLAFGKQAKPTDDAETLKSARWVNANGPNQSKERKDNFQFASDVIRDKAKPILQAGGKIWVMEAGQSDLTAEWVRKLIADGVKNTRTHIVVVQHSIWNEEWTTPEHLKYVKEHANYVTIDDGNKAYAGSPDRGHRTPNYKSTEKGFITEAISDKNPNKKVLKLWATAAKITATTRYKGPISRGAVDFSDTVEAMWIFDLSDKSKNLTTVREFWDTFVINTPVKTPDK